MKIICPNCNSNYMVPAISIGTAGRKVKCIKCSNIWFVQPSEEALKAINLHSNKPIEPKGYKNVPQIIYAKIPILLYILPVLSVICLCIMLIISRGNFNEGAILANIGKAIGINSAKNLYFRDIKIKKDLTNKGTNILLTGQVFNNSTKEIVLPLLRFTIYASDNSVLVKETIKLNKTILKPKEFLPLDLTLYQINQNAESLSIDLGSKLELLMK